ncbi:apolipoprotein L6-like [Mobula birostris]|uniref:apolipoprotein L6-like n=1 Tax=Mobula birostris TaxID=1983395 RepID=UPI003B27F364
MGFDQDLAKKMNELQTEIQQWTEQSLKYITELRVIADCIDEYHADTTKTNIAGSATGVVGGMLSIAGLIASPFTLGSSLVLTGMGAIVGSAGGVTNIVASVSETSYQRRNQKRVDEIIQQYLKEQKDMVNKLELLNKAIESFIKIETRNVPNAVFVGTTQSITKSLNSISTVTSAVTKKALKVFKCVSGVLVGLAVVWDVYSVWKDSKELKDKETEISHMIREVAKRMEEERGNFEKIPSVLKNCTKLQKFQEQLGR